MAIYKHSLYLAGQANMLRPISNLSNKTLIIKYMNGMGDGENNVIERETEEVYILVKTHYIWILAKNKLNIAYLLFFLDLWRKQ